MISRLRKLATAIVAAAGLSACAGGMTGAENVSPSGTDFEQALYSEYLQLAQSERAEWDWKAAKYFTGKALASANGSAPLPADLGAWKLTPYWLAQMEPARAQLIAALDGSARATKPNEAAHAQAMFDCWVQEAEENYQWDDILDCKQEFWAALAQISAAPPPPPPPAPAPLAQGPWELYFAFDRSNISPAAQDEIIRAWNAATNSPDVPMIVQGHTDRAGSESYNLGLSRRRAQAVENALNELGIDSSRLTLGAVGETELAVPTADGVREPRNRRVVIRLVQ